MSPGASTPAGPDRRPGAISSRPAGSTSQHRRAETALLRLSSLSGRVRAARTAPWGAPFFREASRARALNLTDATRVLHVVFIHGGRPGAAAESWSPGLPGAADEAHRSRRASGGGPGWRWCRRGAELLLNPQHAVVVAVHHVERPVGVDRDAVRTGQLGPLSRATDAGGPALPRAGQTDDLACRRQVLADQVVLRVGDDDVSLTINTQVLGAVDGRRSGVAPPRSRRPCRLRPPRSGSC